MIEVLDPSRRKRFAENCHPLFPFCFADDCQPFNVAEVMQVELDVLPRRTGCPTMKVIHDEQNANLAMLLDLGLSDWNKPFVRLFRELAGGLDLDDVPL